MTVLKTRVEVDSTGVEDVVGVPPFFWVVEDGRVSGVVVVVGVGVGGVVVGVSRGGVVVVPGGVVVVEVGSGVVVVTGGGLVVGEGVGEDTARKEC